MPRTTLVLHLSQLNMFYWIGLFLLDAAAVALEPLPNPPVVNNKITVELPTSTPTP